MPRVYKQKKSVRFSRKDIRRALDIIHEGETVRSAAETTGISWRTLMRYKTQKTVSDIPGNVTANQVFTQDEEVRLREYLERSSAMFYGLSTKETRRLAFDFPFWRISQ